MMAMVRVTAGHGLEDGAGPAGHELRRSAQRAEPVAFVEKARHVQVCAPEPRAKRMRAYAVALKRRRTGRAR